MGIVDWTTHHCTWPSFGYCFVMVVVPMGSLIQGSQSSMAHIMLVLLYQQYRIAVPFTTFFLRSQMSLDLTGGHQKLSNKHQGQCDVKKLLAHLYQSAAVLGNTESMHSNISRRNWRQFKYPQRLFKFLLDFCALLPSLRFDFSVAFWNQALH